MTSRYLYVAFTIALLGANASALADTQFDCVGKDRDGTKVVGSLTFHRDKSLSGEIVADGDELAVFENERQVGTKAFGRDRFAAFHLSEDGYGGETYLYVAMKKRGNGSFPIFTTVTRYSEAGLYYSNYARLVCAPPSTRKTN